MKLSIAVWISIFVLIDNAWLTLSEMDKITSDVADFELSNSNNSEQIDSEQLDENNNLNTSGSTEPSINYSTANLPKITWNLVSILRNSTSRNVHSDKYTTLLESTSNVTPPSFGILITTKAQMPSHNLSTFQNMSQVLHDTLDNSENELDSEISDFTPNTSSSDHFERSESFETTLFHVTEMSQFDKDTDLEYVKVSTAKRTLLEVEDYTLTSVEDYTLASVEEYSTENSNILQNNLNNTEYLKPLDNISDDFNSTIYFNFSSNGEEESLSSATNNSDEDYVTFFPFSNSTTHDAFLNEKDAKALTLNARDESVDVLKSNYTESLMTMEATTTFDTPTPFEDWTLKSTFIPEFVSKTINDHVTGTETIGNIQEQGTDITYANLEKTVEAIEITLPTSFSKIDNINRSSDINHSLQVATEVVTSEIITSEAKFAFSGTETNTDSPASFSAILEERKFENRDFDTTEPFNVLNENITFTTATTEINYSSTNSSYLISNAFQSTGEDSHVPSTVITTAFPIVPETTSSFEKDDEFVSGNESIQVSTSEHQNKILEKLPSTIGDYANSTLVESDLTGSQTMKYSDGLNPSTTTNDDFTTEVNLGIMVTVDGKSDDQHFTSKNFSRNTFTSTHLHKTSQGTPASDAVTTPSITSATEEDVAKVDPIIFYGSSDQQQEITHTELGSTKAEGLDFHTTENMHGFSNFEMETTATPSHTENSRIASAEATVTTPFLKEKLPPALGTTEASYAISQAATETHREGKHIPFSTTIKRTGFETAFTMKPTVPTSIKPHFETTEKDVEVFYNQIRPEDLTPDERTNAITAIIEVHPLHYEREELNEKVIIVHLWLLHVIVERHKNSTQNLTDKDSSAVAFENLPQISYVLPTPEINLPNISLSFVAHNIWRNETISAESLLNVLNNHCRELKDLANVKHVHFFPGLLTESYDFLMIVMEKYGVIVLITCFIAVVMILLLVCVVVHYRRKSRYSAHSLTNEKLHRNMQEAMGIDLNPAVIILQDELREKTVLNGSKVCSIDDNEGWLAPIDDVPVPEDTNGPCVQDTKL